MDKKTLEQYKNHFLNEKNTLMNKNEIIEIDIDGDETDRIQGQLLGNVIEKISNRDLERIKKIDRALERIEEGSFGICAECGEQISEKRLKARPEASLCISCASEQERVLKLSI